MENDTTQWRTIYDPYTHEELLRTNCVNIQSFEDIKQFPPFDRNNVQHICLDDYKLISLDRPDDGCTVYDHPFIRMTAREDYESCKRRERKTKKICYDEDFRFCKVTIPGQGFGVIAECNIEPATVLFPYGGKLIKTCRTIQRKLTEGNDKILKVRNRELWWDGKNSRTLGPMLNHACNCISNCEITWEDTIPLVTTKASEQGRITTGDNLTFDYNYDKTKLSNNHHFQWYFEYLSTHICNK